MIVVAKEKGAKKFNISPEGVRKIIEKVKKTRSA
jgi:hypothetical protein